MTTQRSLSASRRSAFTLIEQSSRFCAALTLIGASLLAATAEAQTSYSQRRTTGTARRPMPRQAAAPQGHGTLANYVSGYTGAEEVGTPAVQVAPTPAPTPMPAQPYPGGYEEIGPGIPVGDGPGMPFSQGVAESCAVADGVYVDGECWAAGDCYGGECYPLFGFLRDRVWVNAEYLSWWTDGQHVPVLATTSSNANDAGILFRDSTEILFPKGDLNGDARSGARFTLGTWLGPCDCVGFEVTYTFLSEDSTRYESGEIVNNVLARPFFDSGSAQTGGGVQSSWVLASPGLRRGWVNIDAQNEFYSLEANVRKRLFEDCGRRFDLLTGYRHAALRDKLRINDHLLQTGQDPGGQIAVNTQIDQYDWFDADNTFNGAQVGIAGHWNYCRWSFDTLMKLALGRSQYELNVDGRTTITPPTGTAPPPSRGGLLAQPTNMGRFEHSHFAMIPELGLTVGYDFTCHLRGTIGYSFVYWSKVIRAGEQIDPNVNLPTIAGQLPSGAQDPRILLRTTDFWAQGLSAGFEYRF